MTQLSQKLTRSAASSLVQRRSQLRIPTSVFGSRCRHVRVSQGFLSATTFAWNDQCMFLVRRYLFLSCTSKRHNSIYTYIYCLMWVLSQMAGVMAGFQIHIDLSSKHCLSVMLTWARILSSILQALAHLASLLLALRQLLKWALGETCWHVGQSRRPL